ncbi:hypothetical protein FGIG_11358 [Fasciola gigantica]|uniref:SHSP domain-containing protein n=1 Tax=Fasciola gigantica TaxID=46835 RepID=A0A504YIU6_FASGI|nr:hypothetical protein FGIG_11358 [Fasciola gigantica]
MVKPQGKTIPIHHDKRTFQQGRHDLIRELEKSHGEKKVQKPKANRQIKQAVATHSNQLSTGQWADQLDRWINETNKWWGHDWNRLWRNMFSLVPLPILVHPVFVRGSPTNWRVCVCVQLRFKLRWSTSSAGYEADDIHVETANNRSDVCIKRYSGREIPMAEGEFCRTVYLPDKVDEDKFVSNLSEDGILTVEAPLKEEKLVQSSSVESVELAGVALHLKLVGKGIRAQLVIEWMILC